MAHSPSPARLFRSRLVWISTLVVAAVLPSSRALASAQPPSAPPNPTLEVQIDPTIPDASDLYDWIYEESTRALAELPPSPTRRGTVRVSVSGTLYDYDVSIVTIRDGSTDETTSWSCECTNDDLLARIRGDVQSAAESLDDPLHVPPAPLDPEDPKPTLSLRGKTGFGLLGGGSTATIVGLSLTAAGEPGGGSRKAGIPILSVGLAALVAGTTLIVLEHRRGHTRRAQSRVTVVPFVTRRTAHLGIAGRF